jgi:predicted DNA-binding protein
MYAITIWCINKEVYMARGKTVNNGIKYTVLLPEENVNQLKELSRKRVVNSVNAAVREAIEQYILKLKKETYKKELSEAVNDPEFIKRNDDIKSDFEIADQEIEEMLHKW